MTPRCLSEAAQLSAGVSSPLGRQIFLPRKTEIMGRRQYLISKSILNATFHFSEKPSDRPPTILACILAFLSLFYLALPRYKAELFKRLRNEVWGIDEDEYRESFRSASKREWLVAVGDLEYSGSVSLFIFI